MEISIKGKYFTKIQRNYLIDLADWSGYKLMGGRLSRHINLNIHLISKKDYLCKNIYAITEVSDDDLAHKSRNFTITMTSRFGTMRSLIILAHEMVHVKQFATNELSWCNKRNIDTWKGDPINDMVEYWDYPHEIEALGREKGLVYQWCTYRNLWKESWCKEIF